MKGSTNEKNVNHLAIIMDGNRRWAKSKGLPTLLGHKKGYDKVKEVADWCIQRNILALSVFAFSTENWKRSKKEVEYLMNLLRNALKNEVDEFHKKGIKIKIIGQKERLSKDIQTYISEAEDKTKENKKLLLQIAISYGGRAEIVDAVKRVVLKNLLAHEINEQTIEQHLWTAGTKDPDLIIRTSGEQRVSGFLTWQGVYSELYFTKVYWPDFSKKDLDEAIAEFQNRQRRYGE